MSPRLLAALAVAFGALLTSCAAPAHDGGSSPSASGASSPLGYSRPTVVSVLGDSHSGWPGSWFQRSVANGSIAGVTPGVLSSHPGRTSIALRAWVGEATARGGVVLVQAGTNDLLLDGSPPAQAAADVERLVGDVARTGVRAVLVSVPPSASLGPATLQLDALLKAWAEGGGVPWLDVTTAVSGPDGTWRPGLSDDGIHANDEGGQLMATAAREQLPHLLPMQ